MTSLSLAQVEHFRREGYLHLKGLLGAEEAARYRAEVHHLLQRQGQTDATWASQRGQGTVLEHSHDVHFRSAAFLHLMMDARVTGLATSLIGPNVQLHHNKAFVKPPSRGSAFPMHQDYPYFPHRDHSMIAVIFHFDDAPEDRGCLRVFPGSHKLGPLDSIGEDHHLPTELFPPSSALPLPAKAGDVIAINYLLVHGSGVNQSGDPRTTLLVQLRDPADPPLNNRHQSRGQGMMLAGVDPLAGAFSFAWDAPSKRD